MGDALRALHPGILIIDRHMESAFVDLESESSNYGQFLGLPSADMQRFLAEQAELITVIPSDTYGDIRVYRIDWKRDPG